MTSLRELLRTERAPGDIALWQVPEGYRQGRGCWGGLPVGAFLDAGIQCVADDSLVPRSITAHLLGPIAAGPASIALSVLRRGSATLTLSALMTAREADRDGSPTGEPVVVADAVIVFGSARADDLDSTDSAWSPAPAPQALEAGWRHIEPMVLPPGLAPEFFDHLECRPVSGFPHSRSTGSEVLAWVRPPEGLSADPVVVAALADAMWPASLVVLPTPRPIATLSFHLDLIALPDADDPMLHRGWPLAMSEGYAAEVRQLWSAEGRLLAQNQQTVVVIR